jgi:hypothetical protein
MNCLGKEKKETNKPILSIPHVTDAGGRKSISMAMEWRR